MALDQVYLTRKTQILSQRERERERERERKKERENTNEAIQTMNLHNCIQIVHECKWIQDMAQQPSSPAEIPVQFFPSLNWKSTGFFLCCSQGATLLVTLQCRLSGYLSVHPWQDPHPPPNFFSPQIFLGEARCDTMLPSISSFFI